MTAPADIVFKIILTYFDNHIKIKIETTLVKRGNRYFNNYSVRIEYNRRCMMKKFFLLRNHAVDTSASPEEILKYRAMVILEMEKMGASPQEIQLLRTETILNSIRNKRKPEDVAWAILQ